MDSDVNLLLIRRQASSMLIPGFSGLLEVATTLQSMSCQSSRHGSENHALIADRSWSESGNPVEPRARLSSVSMSGFCLVIRATIADFWKIKRVSVILCSRGAPGDPLFELWDASRRRFLGHPRFRREQLVVWLGLSLCRATCRRGL